MNNKSVLLGREVTPKCWKKIGMFLKKHAHFVS